MLPITVLPSYPAPHWYQLEKAFRALAGTSREFQVDMVDGSFAPSVSWPFSESEAIATSLKQLHSWSDTFALEFDCMVMQPEQYLDYMLAAGAKRIVIHYGSTDNYNDILAHAAAHQYKIGLAFTCTTLLSEVIPYIPQFDYIQVMGIKAVGQQGQPFAAETYTQVRALRAQYPELEIAIDGGVNARTMPALYAAGANRFAPGSAIIAASDPAATYKQLQALVTS